MEHLTDTLQFESSLGTAHNASRILRLCLSQHCSFVPWEIPNQVLKDIDQWINLHPQVIPKSVIGERLFCRVHFECTKNLCLDLTTENWHCFYDQLSPKSSAIVRSAGLQRLPLIWQSLAPLPVAVSMHPLEAASASLKKDQSSSSGAFGLHPPSLQLKLLRCC